MANWSIAYTRRADKDLQNIDKAERDEIITSIKLLTKEPPQGDFKKLTALKGKWRLRVGYWRVIYERDKDHKTYVILRVIRRSSTTYS